MKEKYEEFSELACFGFLGNALDGRSGLSPDGNTGTSFPRSDAEDLSRGLRFIPGEVTLARRRGENVEFVQTCGNPCCWYWKFQDNSRTYYWERGAYVANGKDKPCLLCQNPHTKGGHIEAEKVVK